MKKTLIRRRCRFLDGHAGFRREHCREQRRRPGVGFNDPTPAVPVGGNTGTTVGAAATDRLPKALELWGKTLRSDATIVVQGSFARLTCDAGGGVLAQAGAIQIFADFPNAPLEGHWYGVALANSIAGFDLTGTARSVSLLIRAARPMMRSLRTSTATSASRTASPGRAGTTASTVTRGRARSTSSTSSCTRSLTVWASRISPTSRLERPPTTFQTSTWPTPTTCSSNCRGTSISATSAPASTSSACQRLTPETSVDRQQRHCQCTARCSGPSRACG